MKENSVPACFFSISANRAQEEMCFSVSDFCQHAPALIQDAKTGIAELQSRQLEPVSRYCSPLETTCFFSDSIQLLVSRRGEQGISIQGTLGKWEPKIDNY